MSASYVVQVLDSAGKPAAYLDSVAWKALRYEPRLDDVGMCQFTLPLDDERNALISKHTWVQIYRYPEPDEEQDEKTYILCYRKRFVDEDGQGWAIYGGFTLEFLLLQRYIDPRNDPLVAGGWSTKQDAVDVVMAELVEEQAGPTTVSYQRVPGLTVQTPAAVGEIVSVRLQWENLLEELRKLSSAYQMDFRIDRFDGVNLKFYAERIGSDRSRTANFPGNPYVILTPEAGRMTEPELEEDWREEKTFVYLLGQGADENRELFGSMASSSIDTPYSFAAVVADARDSNLIADYVTQAQEELARHRAKKSFTFKMDRAVEHYKKLYSLGDTVTVEWGDHSEDMRFVAFTVEVTDDETIIPEVASQYAS